MLLADSVFESKRQAIYTYIYKKRKTENPDIGIADKENVLAAFLKIDNF